MPTPPSADADDVQVSAGPDTSTPAVRGKRTFRVVFVSDLGADALRQRTAVDKDSFAQVLASAKPSRAVAVPNPLGGAGDWELRLQFDSLRSFEPGGLLAQVDAGRWRLGLRDKIVARQTARASDDELEQAIAAASQADPTLAWVREAAAAPADAPPPAGAAGSASAGGSILDMVDAPDADGGVRREIEQIAAGAGDAASKLSGPQIARLGGMLARLDRELSAIADALLKHDEVRRLELAWRSLKFMVDRMDFRAGVRLTALSATRDEAVDRLIEQVIEPAFDGEIETPSLIVFDYPFENTPPDLAQLDLLAQHCHSLPAPVTAPLAPAFFGVKNLRLIRNLPNFSSLIDGWEFAKWRTLRDQPYARALAPIVGRFILRPPYDGRSTAGAFAARESVGKISDLLWCYGHVALAVSAARAFAASGWPTRMWGAGAGKVEDLPVVDNPNDPQEPWGPGDLMLPDRRLDELPAIGVNQLVSVKNNDYCMLLGGVSAARPVTTQQVGMQQASLEISLPYQQLNNAISTRLCEIQPELRGLSAEDIQTRLLGELTVLLGVTADQAEAVQVGVGAHPEQPGQTIVQVRVIPPAAIAPGGVPVDYGFAV